MPPVKPLRPAGHAADLAVFIDQRLDAAMASAGVPASPLADDGEFLRRAYLDLIGHIPTHAAAVAFLDSRDPYKRARLVDELLASPEFGQHFAQIWTDTLVKRDLDNNRGLQTDGFSTWLAGQFNKGTGWNKVVSAHAHGRGPGRPAPATFFFLANQDNNQPAPEKLAGAVGNLFMGIQIQCAQCHVHPHVSQWGQQDFWGLAAFFSHTRIERDGPAKGNKKTGLASITEEIRNPKFETRNQAMPKGKPGGMRALPPGAVIAIPDPNDTKKTTGSARAAVLRGGHTASFQQRALSARPGRVADGPGEPLLRPGHGQSPVGPLLCPRPCQSAGRNERSQQAVASGAAADAGREFGTSGFDIKLLLRGIMLSDAYQRTSRPLPGNRDDDRLLSHMPVKVLGARELLHSLGVALEKPGSQDARKFVSQGWRFFDTREVDDDPTEFTHGIPQLLRLMNSNLTNDSAAAAARIARTSGGKPEQVIEGLFLTTLSRRPRPAEAKRMLEFAAGKGDHGYAGVLWALVNSAEFASNR